MHILRPLLFLTLVASSPVLAAQPSGGLLLVTLDTTRADAVELSGASSTSTPVLHGLARRGVRFERALAPAPLTLPSHASLLTGLDPPEHGVRSNGGEALSAALPTVATVLAGHGFETAAVIGSRVLDRRFGLDSGFDKYDDTMPAEQLGQYGYAERDATAVTDRAVAWLQTLGANQRFFLWVHFYDPHAPYEPPGGDGSRPQAARYRAEVEYVDRELGRLLAALPREPEVVVAVVGDHGEALGDHGEATHGIFLYDSVLHVPLVIAGPGVPRGRSVHGPVAIARLAPTLLRALGVEPPTSMPPALDLTAPAGDEPVYSETMFPADVYGWAPLRAITSGRWRYIDAPRPELYDLEPDPREQRNLVAERVEIGKRLGADLERLAGRPPLALAERAEVDADMEAALVALGYVEPGTRPIRDGIDPKDGVARLAELEAATAALERQPGQAVSRLRDLAAQNPSNVVFRSRLAMALLRTGDAAGAVAEYRAIVDLAPGSEFHRLRLAEAERLAGELDAASSTAREALRLDPRFAAAWLFLAGLEPSEPGRLGVLHEALAAGVTSTRVLRAAASLESKPEDREARLAAAVEIAPDDAAAWLDWGVQAVQAGRLDTASERLHAALELDPTNPMASLELGRVLLRQGDPAANGHLLRASVLGRGTPLEAEARRLLDEARKTPTPNP